MGRRYIHVVVQGGSEQFGKVWGGVYRVRCKSDKLSWVEVNSFEFACVRRMTSV